MRNSVPDRNHLKEEAFALVRCRRGISAYPSKEVLEQFHLGRGAYAAQTAGVVTDRPGKGESRQESIDITLKTALSDVALPAWHHLLKALQPSQWPKAEGQVFKHDFVGIVQI